MNIGQLIKEFAKEKGIAVDEDKSKKIENRQLKKKERLAKFL